MAIYPYSFTLPPVNKQDIPSNGVPGEFLGISAGGVLDWLPVSGGSGTGDLLAANNLSELTPTAGTARTNLGLGTSDSPIFANLTLTSPSLSSSAPVTISQTWNNAAVAFTGLKVNAAGTSDANSATASKLLDLQIGSISKFSVDKYGITTSFGAFRQTPTGAGINVSANGNRLALLSNNSTVAYLDGVNFVFDASAILAWSSGSASSGTFDTALVRDSPSGNTLALRNGANTQTFNVYGSYGSISDYKRLSISCDQTTGNATITNQAAGYTAGTVSINGVPVGLGVGNNVSNVAIGVSAALLAFTNSVAIGYFSSSNVSSGNNVSIGTYSAQNNNSGDNVSIGSYSHQQGGAFQSVAVGAFASQKLGGLSNSIVGAYAMQGTQAGNNNNAFGRFAGRYITDGTTLNLACNNSIFIGANTRPLANSQTNQIVIGDSAIGIGDNSVVLGNDSITKTALKGNVGIGTTAPGALLEIRGTAVSGTRENLLKCTMSDGGNDAFNVFNGTSTDGRFVPSFSGSVFSGSGASPVLSFVGQTTSANDTGTVPLSIFLGRITSSETDPNNGTHSSVATRPLFAWWNLGTSLMQLNANGNLGIGTTLPTSKLHVAGNSSPSITVDNTLATGASQLLFKNTVVTGDTDGIFLNGSAQSGFGGNGSLNIKATTGPLAFHTNTVTNALSIAQNGVATFAISIAVNSAVRTSFINNIGDSLSMFNFVNDSTGTSTYAVGGSAPLMRFGGTTTSFPAIKRSATTLQIRLANDSDFAPIQGKLTTDTAFTGTTVTPTGFITLYDSTGAAYKVPCVPA